MAELMKTHLRVCHRRGGFSHHLTTLPNALEGFKEEHHSLYRLVLLSPSEVNELQKDRKLITLRSELAEIDRKVARLEDKREGVAETLSDLEDGLIDHTFRDKE